MESVNQIYRKLGLGGLVFGLHTDTGFANYTEPEYDIPNLIRGIVETDTSYQITNDSINSFFATSGSAPSEPQIDGLGYPIQDPRNPINTFGFLKVTSAPVGTDTPAEFTSVRLSGIANPEESGKLGFFIASPKNQEFTAKITILGDLKEAVSVNNYARNITAPSGTTIIEYSGYENKNLDFIVLTTELPIPSGYILDDTVEESSSSSSSQSQSLASSSSSSNAFQIPIYQ
jgi:hypothetical protein